MTNCYQCDVCDKTMSQNDTIPKFEAVGVTHLCNKCLNPTEFAFSACTADQPEPSIGFCDGCDELEAELHLMDGDWLCDKEQVERLMRREPIHTYGKPLPQGTWWLTPDPRPKQRTTPVTLIG